MPLAFVHVPGAPTGCFAKQRTRHLINRGICAERGIHLVVSRAEDLTLAGLLHKVSGLLPLRDLSGGQPLVAFLEFASRRYRMEATRDAPGTRNDPGKGRDR